MKLISNVCTFRLDDITPDMDWDKFYRIKAIFDKYKVKPLIGVVPDNEDENLKRGEYREDFWEYVASLRSEGWSIAQHGFCHRYETDKSGLLGLKRASEFAGLSLDKQILKLQSGKDILQKNGIDVKIFMAPGHTYDRNTLKALKRLGFTCVSDGYADVPYYEKGLLFIPCRTARPRIRKGVDTVCIHCNELDEAQFGEIELFLEKCGAHVLSFEEVINQLWYQKKNPAVFWQEKKNLLMHRMKKHVAVNPAFQQYFACCREGGGSMPAKRILYLPSLLKNLLKGRGKARKTRSGYDR